MKKYKQKQVRQLVRDGIAEDITALSFEKMAQFLHGHDLEKIGVSRGIYGMNAGLLQDRQTGELYAITTRNSALFMAF